MHRNILASHRQECRPYHEAILPRQSCRAPRLPEGRDRGYQEAQVVPGEKRQ